MFHFDKVHKEIIKNHLNYIFNNLEILSEDNITNRNFFPSYDEYRKAILEKSGKPINPDYKDAESFKNKTIFSFENGLSDEKIYYYILEELVHENFLKLVQSEFSCDFIIDYKNMPSMAGFTLPFYKWFLQPFVFVKLRIHEDTNLKRFYMKVKITNDNVIIFDFEYFKLFFNLENLENEEHFKIEYDLNISPETILFDRNIQTLLESFEQEIFYIIKKHRRTVNEIIQINQTIKI